MSTQLTEGSNCKLCVRIDPAEGRKSIKDNFPTSSLRQDLIKYLPSLTCTLSANPRFNHEANYQAASQMPGTTQQITVPTDRLIAVFLRFPFLLILKTTIGSPFSLHKVTAVESITFKRFAKTLS